jgi:hypothetical protein
MTSTLKSIIPIAVCSIRVSPEAMSIEIVRSPTELKRPLANCVVPMTPAAASTGLWVLLEYRTEIRFNRD